MTAPARQPQGLPTGGQFAPDTHAEPDLALGADTNRFADLEDVRELDATASAALRPLLSADSSDEDEIAAGKIRNEWLQRRTEIFTVRRRKEFADYARRLEDQASGLLASAAQANLRNIADDLRIKHPQAARITLARDYDDGNLAIYVESVQDDHGTDLGEDVADTAQELVSEHSSRQLARFTEGPVDLEKAASWIPPEGPRSILRD